MKVVLALIFGALAQGQTSTQGRVSSLVAPLPQKQAAAPAASSSVLAKSATPVPITPPRASNNATALKDRQFFVANPIMDAMLVSTLAPKSTSSTSASTSASTTSSSSSSGLASTLLVASMLNSGNQQQQRPRYSQPQYNQYGQPQYFAPRYQDSYGYDSHYGAQQEDPLKKMVLLSGVVSGSMNPLAAVAMDNNKQMSSTDALVMSSLGNNPLSTMLAVGGGGSGGSGSLFGSGSGSSNNMLTTLAVASAFAPKSSSSSSSSALGTLATLSLLNQNQNNGGSSGSGSSSSGGGLFAGLFGN